MLQSVQIQKRQSEIRQALTELAAKEKPTDDETRSMQDMDTEYRTNETRFRAALTAEDTERREAGTELETRSGREFASLVDAYELRQVALYLDEGQQLSGQTAEVVNELRSQGGYRGVPVPYMALERRAGETIASGTPNPVATRPTIDRLFPSSVAGRMGVQIINIGSGAVEYPVVTSSVTAAWAASELGAVGGPTAYATTDKALNPDNTLGITMKISRKTLKQSGDAVEQAIRRDMQGTLQTELDKSVFLGSGSSGEPLGVIAGAGTYGITSTAAAGAATWAEFRAAITRFLAANAANSASDVRVLIRPEVMDYADSTLISGTAVSEYDRLTRNVSNITMSSNALAAPTGSPAACTALLTTSAGGVAPAFVGLWGAVDMIRDPYSDATSGGLRITALVTLDVTVARAAQLQLITGLEVAAA
jgi:HK97 family phage major capsid protein